MTGLAVVPLDRGIVLMSMSPFPSRSNGSGRSSSRLFNPRRSSNTSSMSSTLSPYELGIRAGRELHRGVYGAEVNGQLQKPLVQPQAQHPHYNAPAEFNDWTARTVSTLVHKEMPEIRTWRSVA